MRYRELQELISNNKNRVICFSGKKTLNSHYLIYKLSKNENVYLVGKSKKRYFKRYTVYEELNELMKNSEELNKYIFKRELSVSRLNRPLESLSSEKWRASIAIGLITGKNIFVIPYISKQILDMYGEKWLDSLFKECCDYQKTIILFSDDRTINNHKFDNIVIQI